MSGCVPRDGLYDAADGEESAGDGEDGETDRDETDDRRPSGRGGGKGVIWVRRDFLGGGFLRAREGSHQGPARTSERRLSLGGICNWIRNILIQLQPVPNPMCHPVTLIPGHAVRPKPADSR